MRFEGRLRRGVRQWTRAIMSNALRGASRDESHLAAA